MQGNYTNLEYLQIAVFLFGTPIAALAGAMLGLIGKWNQGRVVTAALMGLGSAAFVTVVLFFTFLVIHWQILDGSQSSLLEFFDGYFGRRIAILAAISTAVIALLAGIGLRSRTNERARATSFSMRQLLLLQLFAFIALGCWTGMRFFALKSGSDFERIQRIWRAREWGVSGDSQRGPNSMARDMRAVGRDMVTENAHLREAVRQPWLKYLNLMNVNDFQELEFEEIANASELEGFYWETTSKQAIGSREINTIGKLKSLRTLVLRGRGKIDRDIGPIAALPDLRALHIGDLALAPEALSQLSESKELQRLGLFNARNATPKTPVTWPANLLQLDISHNTPVSRWRLDTIDRCTKLQTLGIHGQRLMKEEVEAITRIEGLESLHLNGAIRDADMASLGKLKHLRMLSLTEGGVRRTELFRKSALELCLLPELEHLFLDAEILIEANEGMPGGPVLPEISELDMRKIRYNERINLLRVETGLPPLDIKFTTITPPFFGYTVSPNGSVTPEGAPEEKSP